MRTRFLLLLLLCGCDPAIDAGSRLPADGGVLADGGLTDDASALDGAAADAGPADAGPADAGPADAGPADAGVPDTGVADTGVVDTSVADTGVADTGVADTGAMFPPALDLSAVTWLHTNVSGWAETATLASVQFRSGQICLDYDRADVWAIGTIGGVDVVGNPWVFIWRDGRWYGATWEWLRPGQICKAQTSVAGDHIKVFPFDAASGWRPASGEVFYFMVSGLARSSQRNSMERTQPVRVRWP